MKSMIRTSNIDTIITTMIGTNNGDSKLDCMEFLHGVNLSDGGCSH